MKNKDKSYKIIFYSLIILLTLGFIIGMYYVLKIGFKVKDFNKEIDVEYNSSYNYSPGKVCYGNLIFCKSVSTIKNGVVDTTKLGKYKVNYIYTYYDKKYILEQIVNVKDMTKPKLKISDKEVIVCPNGKIGNINLTVKDNYDKDFNDKITKTLNKNIVTVSVKDSSGNITQKNIKAKIEDKLAPELKLNGADTVYVFTGGTYNDEGVSISDNCDDHLNVNTSNDINYSTPGTYHITYSTQDSNSNKSEIQREVIVRNKPSSKRIIYLTFDDGPSEHTNRLLDVLKKYNVKATFFVTGRGSDDAILREYKEGHQIALHTNSHSYAAVYSSVDNYFNDLQAISDRVERITGYKSKLIRFPGGSSNTVSRAYSRGIMSTLTREVENRGYKYFDWNVSSGDAGGTTTSDGVFNNVIVSLKEDYSIVLQHDVHGFSVDAVERIIKYGLENGYTFEKLNESSPTAHHGVNN